MAGVACGALKATQSVHLLELASTGLAGHNINGVHDLYSWLTLLVHILKLHVAMSVSKSHRGIAPKVLFIIFVI